MSKMKGMSRSCLLIALIAVAGCCGNEAGTESRVVNLSDWHGVCVDAPDRAVQKVHPRGIDSHVGEISLGDASVTYHVGFGLQGDLRRGYRKELPQLSHGEAHVYSWADPDLTAIVVEGLEADGARANVWYVFDSLNVQSRRLAKQLAQRTDYCNPKSNHR